jgi:hypothetical protein
VRNGKHANNRLGKSTRTETIGSEESNEVLTFHLDTSSKKCMLVKKKPSQYFRTMVLLSAESNTRLNELAESSGCSKSVVIEYLLNTVDLIEFDAASHGKRLPKRRLGRTKKLYHDQ